MATQHASSDKEMQDFWREVNDIELGKDAKSEGDTGSSEDELDSKTPDEAEEAAEWLHSTGYGAIADKVLDGKDVTEDFETRALTKAQQATIRKRINTLKSTLHRKRQTPNKIDVRDVFTYSTEPPSPQPELVRPSRDSRSSVGSDSGFFQGGNTELSGQAPTRNVSLLRRREYNMSGDGSATESVQMLSIHPKIHASRRTPSENNEDVLHSDPTPLSGSDIALSLQTSRQVVLRRPRSPKSPFYLSTDPPPSPSSNTSSPPPLSPGYTRGAVDYTEGLPKILIQPDSLGMTQIEDLSPTDVAKLKPLMLVELTSLFDHYHVLWVKRKSKKKYRENGIFGVPLQTLLDYDQKRMKNPNLTIPLFIRQLIRFLEKDGVPEEGILRVPGSVMRIKSLRQEIEEKFNSGTFNWDEVRPNDAAGLLKQFLRELPTPTLTFDMLEAFAQVEKFPVFEDQVHALRLLILLLPDVNRNTLKLLLTFLWRVVDHKENRMTVNNVAMIMAPNLFLVQSGRSSKGIKDSDFKMAAGTSNVVRMFMYYQDVLWTVPSTILQQMRHQNESDMNRKSKDKPMMKFWGRNKDRAAMYQKPPTINENDVARGVIRVQVPVMTKFHTAIQLCEDMTAGDIVSRCLHDIAGPQAYPPQVVAVPHGGPALVGRGVANGRNDGSCDEAGDNQKERNQLAQGSSLYEIGGNIFERRLDKQAKVLDVLKINPGCEWVIKKDPSPW